MSIPSYLKNKQNYKIYSIIIFHEGNRKRRTFFIAQITRWPTINFYIDAKILYSILNFNEIIQESKLVVG